jgi:acyl carrier protein
MIMDNISKVIKILSEHFYVSEDEIDINTLMTDLDDHWPLHDEGLGDKVESEFGFEFTGDMFERFCNLETVGQIIVFINMAHE